MFFFPYYHIKIYCKQDIWLPKYWLNHSSFSRMYTDVVTSIYLVCSVSGSQDLEHVVSGLSVCLQLYPCLLLFIYTRHSGGIWCVHSMPEVLPDHFSIYHIVTLCLALWSRMTPLERGAWCFANTSFVVFFYSNGLHLETRTATKNSKITCKKNTALFLKLAENGLFIVYNNKNNRTQPELTLLSNSLAVSLSLLVTRSFVLIYRYKYSQD